MRLARLLNRPLLYGPSADKWSLPLVQLPLLGLSLFCSAMGLACAASVVGVVSGSGLAAAGIAALAFVPFARQKKPDEQTSAGMSGVLALYKRDDDWRLLGPLTAFVRTHAGPHVSWDMEAHQQSNAQHLPHVIIHAWRRQASIKFSMPAWRTFVSANGGKSSDSHVLKSAYFALAHELAHTQRTQLRMSQLTNYARYAVGRGMMLSLGMSGLALLGLPFMGVPAAVTAGLVGSGLLGVMATLLGGLSLQMVARQQEAAADRSALALCGAVPTIFNTESKLERKAGILHQNILTTHYSDYNRRRELRYYFKALGRPAQPPLQPGLLPSEQRLAKHKPPSYDGAD